MGAIGVHHTDTEEGAWDGPGAVAAMPNEAETLRYCHAWVNGGGDADAKQSYKFPHHTTKGGPANMPGVRNALARLSQADIPAGDRAGVEQHLRAHMDDANPEEESGERGNYERRSFPAELRASTPDPSPEGGGEKPRIEGVAAVYNQPTRIDTIFGSYVEVIEPGFFEGVMENDVRALWNHNTDLVLGRTKSGTLEIKDQKAGLGTVIYPPDTQWGRDAVTSIQRGDVDQMSFAFNVKTGWDEWKENEEGVMVRRLKAGACKQLYDVSPVSFPAYPQTSVAVRSHLQERQRGAGDGSHVGGGDQGIPQDPTLEQAQGRRRQSFRKNITNTKLKE